MHITKNRVLLPTIIMIVLLLALFTLYSFYGFLFPHSAKGIVDLAYGWTYYTDSDPQIKEIPYLGRCIEANPNETMHLFQTLREGSPSVLLVKNYYQNIKVTLDQEVLLEGEANPSQKNPGVGLNFIKLPQIDGEKVLKLEVTSPYERYAGNVRPVYMGEIDALYGHILEESALHLFFLFACVGTGLFFIVLAMFSLIKGNPQYSNLSFGIFSVLWGFFCICRDDIICLFFSPSAVSNIGIGLNIVYLVPLMAYFCCQITILKKFTRSLLVTFLISVVIFYILHFFHIKDFADTIKVFNVLHSLLFAPFILIAFVEFYRGNQFVRYIAPSVLLLVLAGGGTVVEYFSNYRGLGTSLYLLSVFLFIFTIWVYHIRILLKKRAAEKKDIIELRMKNELTLKSYEEMTYHLKQVRMLRHEVGHHFAALKILCKKGEIERVSDYLDKVDQSNITESMIYSENSLVDSILAVSISYAREAGIPVDYEVKVPHKLSVQDADLCSLLMNMLDNAIEANKSCVNKEECYIRLKIFIKADFLVISCQNAHNNTIVEADDHFRTSKKAEHKHGYGIAVMKDIVKKYGSILDISYDSNSFHVKTVIQTTGSESIRGNNL